MRISDWSSDVCSSDLSLGLLVIDEPQRRAIGGEAVAAAEAMFVVDLTIAGGLKLDQPVARPVAERPGDARRRIAVAEDRIFALEPPRQPRLLFAHDIGEQGIALHVIARRSEEHTSELQSLMRNSYAVFCLKKKT